MLVLSRKRNEAVICGKPGKELTIYVVDIRGDKVRLGFEAAKNVPVHRQEIWDEIYKDGKLPPGGSICDHFCDQAAAAVDEWDGQDNGDLLRLLADKFGISVADLIGGAAGESAA